MKILKQNGKGNLDGPFRWRVEVVKGQSVKDGQARASELLNLCRSYERGNR